mgnify:CR=1 FL=1
MLPGGYRKTHNEELREKIHAFSYQRCYDIAKQGLADKHKRAELFGAVKEDFKATLSEEEMNQRLKMRRSLISKKSMKKGQIITEEDILIKRPGDGIPPSEIKNILGRILNKDIEEEEKFSWDMINN